MRYETGKDRKMRNLHTFATGLAFLAIGSGAAAQSAYSPAQRDFRSGSVNAGIVIPFGGSGSSAERAPRLEAWSEPGRSHQGPELSLRSDREGAYGLPTRLGVTLASNPRMMANGREIPGQDDRHGVSTLGWVGIGLGVVVIAAGAILIAYKNREFD